MRQVMTGLEKPITTMPVVRVLPCLQSPVSRSAGLTRVLEAVGTKHSPAHSAPVAEFAGKDGGGVGVVRVGG